MKAPINPDSARKSALDELASLTSIELGTLSEFHRVKQSPDGSGAVRGGPYFKHQHWENGRNRSTYIPSDQVESLRQDLENGKRFQQITADLAAAAIQQSRARRSAAAPTPDTAEKKTSNPNASPKNTAKQSSSSTKHAKKSPKKKNTKT
jgi:hypothetical protein